MKITAIIPTYNRVNSLEKAIKSILAQSEKVDEIIVVDDGSTDGTKELCESLHVNYIFLQNSGVSSARNIGIKKAKHEWLAFLDSDDSWESDKIKLQKEFHLQNPQLLASYTDERWIREGKEINIPKHLAKEIPSFENSLRTCKIGASTFLCHKSIFESVGLFDESFKACEDYDLWLRILKSFSIGYLAKKLTCKVAGEPNQLSFCTPNIDIFRILALKKHLFFSPCVVNEYNYKLEILKKGALKHNNQEILQFCTDNSNLAVSIS